MSRATLIVNPFASRVTEERVRAVERVLAPAETLLTEQRGHAVELARGVRGDTVYVYGGDGVYNEVLNGVDGRVALGFVPGGAANVLPRALGLPEDPLAASRRLVARRTRRISLGRVNGRRFAFSSGLGIDADAVRRVDAMGRGRDGRRPGDLAFVSAVVQIMVAHRGRYQLELELRAIGRAGLIFVSNSPVFTYLGPVPIRFSPLAGFELGLDYAAPAWLGPGSLIWLLGRGALGLGLPGARHVLSGHDADRLEAVCSQPVPLQADGEDLGDVAEAVFEAERDAVTVLV